MKTIVFSITLLLTTLSLQAQLIPELPTDISPLLIGEKIPDITLRALDGKPKFMSEILDNHKTILVFYRGGWCPYCNAQLIALAKTEAELIDLGYQIIAVSPDSPKSLAHTEEEDEIGYQLFSDSRGELTKAVGIAYKVPENQVKQVLKGSEGDNISFLPVPSVLIINEKREIMFEYINPEFTQRLSVDFLLAVAKSLANIKKAGISRRH